MLPFYYLNVAAFKGVGSVGRACHLTYMMTILIVVSLIRRGGKFAGQGARRVPVNAAMEKL